jgi:HAD superfamily hydrolase (TIGR01509 family)
MRVDRQDLARSGWLRSLVQCRVGGPVSRQNRFMPAAVVFDLDGVLIDSEPVWEQVRRAVVADHGGRWLPDAQGRLMGMSTTEWAHYLSEDLHANLPADAVAELVISRMADRYTQRLPLLAGAVEAVLSAATRWPVAVASSSPPRLIDAALSSAGLRDAFRVTVSTDEVVAGKPAPDVYLLAVERLGAAAGECVAVEDSSNGLRAASAAGMHVVAVPRPEYPPEPAALAQAEVVIDSLRQLTPTLIAALGP